MNTLRQFIFCLSAVAVATTSVALADDTEIYSVSGNSTTNAKPNVVFIIDSSGSMDSDVVVATSSYDPSQTYDGNCTTDKVYWSTDGTAPSCGTSRYVLSSSNKCSDSQIALSASGEGVYVAQAARYRSRNNGDRWDTLSSNDHSSPVECRADYGIHGSGADGNYYPADQSAGGPWRADDTGAINWNTTGLTYTFYNANYLNWVNGPGATTTKTRLNIVKEVFSNLMDGISNLNISVMRFDDRSQTANRGGYFVMPMQELTSANRQSYKDAVNAITAGGFTPLSETLYEAYLFYKGAAPYFGNSTSPSTNVAGVLQGSSYNSPIDYQCQKNFVILLTDGEPTYDTDADSLIQAMPGFSATTGAAACDGDCLDELADYMNTKDCSNLADKQNVITYTIGFNTNQTLLSEAARKGGGKYFTADNTAELTNAFTSIVTEIMAINSTFVAPAVTVNAFNRFTHRDELYYVLFRPSGYPKWNGNVKRFRLAGNPPIIVDRFGVPAIDENTGFFKPNVTSFWTDSVDAPDGDVVEKGGAASRLTLVRPMYTYTGSTAPSNVDLTLSANLVQTTNTALSASLLGDANMSATRRLNLINWIKGVDVLDDDSDKDSTDARRFMGDPLHTKPVLITYGGTDADPDITLYAATNHGYLHAINTTTGSEVFSFVPQEMLPQIATLYDDNAAVEHPYGLDGPLTTWINDVNGNGKLLSGNTLEANEFAYLYLGMRRGGDRYYSLDVSQRERPVFKWTLEGGIGEFKELAQTWSAMTTVKVKFNGVDRTVAFFGGGYDTHQDSAVDAGVDSMGRAIFMVDADSGTKLWQAGPAGSGNASGSDPNLVLSDMTHSIPSDVRVIDIDGDGLRDRLYVGDMGGRIWRFDFNPDNSGASDFASGGILANLGGVAAADRRRFYYAPDVSLSKDKQFLSVAIGSGYRAKPTNQDIHDAFFVIRDKNVFGPALDASGSPVYTPINFNDLFNATSNILGEGTESQIDAARASLDRSGGFYINLKSGNNWQGEKVLAKSITFSGNIMFTTFTPVANAQAAACSPSQGQAKAYLINLLDGTPVQDMNNSGGDLTADDRAMDLVRGGIPPEPKLLIHENGPVVLIGTEKGPDPKFVLTPQKLRWKRE